MSSTPSFSSETCALQTELSASLSIKHISFGKNYTERKASIPSGVVALAAEAVTVPPLMRGVAGITRNTPPKESICRTLPSLFRTGTERERWMGN